MGIYEQIDNAFMAGKNCVYINTGRFPQNELSRWRKATGRAAISGLHKGMRAVVFLDNLTRRKR